MSISGERLVIVALAGGALAMSACGASEREMARSTSERPRAVDVEPFLLRNGDQPGVRRVGTVFKESGVAAFVNGNQLPAADAAQLRSDGFISITVQRLEGRGGVPGVSNVHLFATAEGARHWLEHEQRPDVIRSYWPRGKIERFTVPGLPGARGWTRADVGNVFWVQGRCLLVLGYQRPGPLAGPLSAGARAVHERTNGECP